MKMTTNDNILFVGTLQVYAKPFASLYMDKAVNVLLLFVRLDDSDFPGSHYVVTEVKPADVERYMDRKIWLKTLMNSNIHSFATIRDNVIHIVHNPPSIADDINAARFRMFDARFCDDRIGLKCFLSSFENQ